jgi:hypothetical protein
MDVAGLILGRRIVGWQLGWHTDATRMVSALLLLIYRSPSAPSTPPSNSVSISTH